VSKSMRVVIENLDPRLEFSLLEGIGFSEHTWSKRRKNKKNVHQ